MGIKSTHVTRVKINCLGIQKYPFVKRLNTGLLMTLREHRRGVLDLSLEDVAIRSGLSASFHSSVENGANFSEEAKRAMAGAYELTVKNFLKYRAATLRKRAKEA